MAQLINGSTTQIKLNNGAVVTGQQGGWYDGQQLFNGTLSQAGVINSQSNQQGAGQAVSKEVVAQTNPANVAYLKQQNPNAAPANPVDTNGAAANVGGGTTPGAGSGGGVGIAPPATINLPGIYQSLSDKAGISDLEKQLSDQQTSYNTAQSQINDNPFLSEASRVGRIQKLTTDYNNNTKATQDTLAMKNADIQTQLSLQTQQFNINSQAAQQGLQQFQTLLSSGALDNASGQDIANITTATGLSSDMIQSAVSAQKQKDVNTSVIQYDDGTNQGFAVINTQTGAVINKQVIGPSKPSTTGNSTTASTNKSEALAQLPQDAQSGWTLGTLMNFYQQYGLTPQQIYTAYNAVNYYKATSAQQKADQAKYNVK